MVMSEVVFSVAYVACENYTNTDVNVRAVRCPYLYSNNPYISVHSGMTMDNKILGGRELQGLALL